MWDFVLAGVGAGRDAVVAQGRAVVCDRQGLRGSSPANRSRGVLCESVGIGEPHKSARPATAWIDRLCYGNIRRAVAKSRRNGNAGRTAIAEMAASGMIRLNRLT